jgi:hypothetical protein
MQDDSAAPSLGLPPLSPAFRLLCACIVWPPSPQSDAETAAAAASIDNWNAFLDLLRRHRVEGIAAYTLKRVSPHIPEHVLREVSAAAAEIVRRNLLLAETLRVVTDALEREAIPSLTLKGAPLAQIAYGNIAQRQAKDIDILVRQSDVDGASAVLRRLGFQRALPAEGVGPNGLKLWSWIRKDFAFRNDRAEVELHWRPAENPYLFSLAWDSSRWRTVALAPAISVRTLDPESMFAYLCVHGATGGWFRLKWLADIGALLSPEPPGGVRRLYESARRSGVGRPAGQALLLCSRLLKSPVPEDLLSELAKDRMIAGLARHALLSIVRDGIRERHARVFATVRTALSRIRLSRSLRFKLREVVYDLSNPEDAFAAGFPDGLIFVYPLLRPFVWLYMKLCSHGLRPDSPPKRRKQ